MVSNLIDCFLELGLSHILGNNVRSRDTLCPLSDEEFAGFFAWPIDIVRLLTDVGLIVVGNIVNVVLVQKLGGDDPWRILDNFINPFAVTESLCSFTVRQHSKTFPLVRFRIVWNADEEVGIGECLFGLFKLSHVPSDPLEFPVLMGELTAAYPRWNRSKTPSA